MLSNYQIDFLTNYIFKGNECEKCETGNLRVKGHIEYDAFEELISFCKTNSIVFTLGRDGVLVVHD